MGVAEPTMEFPAAFACWHKCPPFRSIRLLDSRVTHWNTLIIVAYIILLIGSYSLGSIFIFR